MLYKQVNRISNHTVWTNLNHLLANPNQKQCNIIIIFCAPIDKSTGDKNGPSKATAIADNKYQFITASKYNLTNNSILNSTASSSSPPQQQSTPLQQTTTSSIDQQQPSSQELEGNLQTTPVSESINLGNNNSLTITSIQDSIDITSNHTNSSSEPIDDDSSKQPPSSGSLKKVSLSNAKSQLAKQQFYPWADFFIILHIVFGRLR